METHAHDLHKAPGHGWKHYFFEFFMLFLAVFCGFFAENLREQSVERRREKEYMVSMIEDLKSDTANIARFAVYRNDRRRRMDSLSWLLLQPDYLQNTALIYFYARWVPRNNFFNTNDRTLQQLKTAGGMRLITNHAAVDAIMSYDDQVKVLNTQEYVQEVNEVLKFIDMMTGIFDGNVLDKMYQDSLLTKPSGNPPLLTNDPRVLHSCITLLHFVKSLNRRNIYFENNLKTQAVHTIQEVLKREYQIE